METVNDLLRLDRFYQQLYRWRLDDWIVPIDRSIGEAVRRGQTGHWQSLLAAACGLPAGAGPVTIRGGVVTIDDDSMPPQDRHNDRHNVQTLTDQLRSIGPWEKGPWEILGVAIDAQWRSDLKWDRIVDCVDWRGRIVMDLGCGNGYYAWRMLDAGASMVIGVDPTASSVCQFGAVSRISDCSDPPMILPLRDSDLPLNASGQSKPSGLFDVVTSMGVLYHHVSPIEHLRRIIDLLARDGTAIIETLVVPDAMTALTPLKRYAAMANVWIIPSIGLLRVWLKRVGFGDIEIVDQSVTTSDEQHRTPWSPGHSLAEGLDPADPSKTIEGYPGCRRVVVRCRGR